VVTVTGTNGKGSTCAFVASLLRAQGLKVGVYSSPHLLRYNERVLIDGVEASDERCAKPSPPSRRRGDTSLTYFEMGTLAAFWLFYQSQLDAVVLEVGLGGRLDTVNVVDADLALVTSIGVDHVDYLGDTREPWPSRRPGSSARASRPCAVTWIRRKPLLDKAANWPPVVPARARFRPGQYRWQLAGAVLPPMVRRSSCMTCRCSTCRWKTPRWPCRLIC
jgi:dihydrofolate synthase/folylpolyglutamate synthase